MRDAKKRLSSFKKFSDVQNLDEALLNVKARQFGYPTNLDVKIASNTSFPGVTEAFPFMLYNYFCVLCLYFG